VSISLDWQGLGILVFDRPNQYWRAVKMTVTAGRDHEFVIAGGGVEARPNDRRGRWVGVARLSDVRMVPRTVEKNRFSDQRLSGSTLRDAIAKTFPGCAEVDLRIRLHDHHRTRITSEPLSISTAELGSEKFV